MFDNKYMAWKYFLLTYYIRTFDRIRLEVEPNLIRYLDIATRLMANDDVKKQPCKSRFLKSR